MIPKTAVLTALLVLVLAAAAPAQYQGRIAGRVLDSAGHPIEKAEVSIVSQRTSTIRYEMKTDREGRFVQIGLMPGYYLVSVKKAGFAPGSKEIKVGVAGEEVLEVTLKSVEAAVEKALSAADKNFLNGNKLYSGQKYEEAAKAYEAAIGLDPANWAYHLNLGLARKKSGQAPEAQAAFLEAAGLNPESYSANKEAGESLAKDGRFAEARPYYEKAAGLSPDDPDAQYNLGVCLINVGESETALAHFEKAVELKPDYVEAYYQMGTILIGQNKAPEAIASLEKFLSLDPENEKAGIARQLLDFLKKK